MTPIFQKSGKWGFVNVSKGDGKGKVLVKLFQKLVGLGKAQEKEKHSERSKAVRRADGSICA